MPALVRLCLLLAALLPAASALAVEASLKMGVSSPQGDAVQVHLLAFQALA